MLTIHTARLLLPGAGLPPVPGGAVALDGGLIQAVGDAEELDAALPRARTRHWPGLLTPGLRHPGAAALLDDAYHPDPREADTLGTAPLTGPALAALARDDGRWGGSARRGVQRLLACGVTAVAGPFRRAPVRAAVRRAGLVEVRSTAPPGPVPPVPPLDPLALLPPAAAFAGTLAPGARADLAAFALPDTEADGPDPLAALHRAGATTCAATVLAGRLVHRTR